MTTDSQPSWQSVYNVAALVVMLFDTWRCRYADGGKRVGDILAHTQVVYWEEYIEVKSRMDAEQKQLEKSVVILQQERERRDEVKKNANEKVEDEGFICSSCGAEISRANKVCSSCGEKLDWENETETTNDKPCPSRKKHNWNRRRLAKEWLIFLACGISGVLIGFIARDGFLNDLFHADPLDSSMLVLMPYLTLWFVRLALISYRQEMRFNASKLRNESLTLLLCLVLGFLLGTWGTYGIITREKTPTNKSVVAENPELTAFRKSLEAMKSDTYEFGGLYFWRDLFHKGVLTTWIILFLPYIGLWFFRSVSISLRLLLKKPELKKNL